jgi:hypothetical protein
MEQLLIQLARRAHGDQVVAAHTLANGMRLLVYPLERGLIVGVGFDRDLAYRVHPESLVQRRSMHLSRFGAWLPAMFADGSLYAVRRFDYFNPASDVPVLTDDDLMVAQELMS